MARAKVELNRAGVLEVLTAPGVLAELVRRGEAVAATARATAPVRTGDYRDHITVQPGVSPVDGRARVIVGSTARHAPLVEARTGNLARALNAGGGA